EHTKPQVTVCETHLRLPDFCSSLSQDFIPTLEEIEELLREKAEFLRDEASELHPAGGKVESKSELSSGSSGAQPISSVAQEDVPNTAQPGGAADGGDQAAAAGTIPVVLQIQPLHVDSLAQGATGGVRVTQLIISLQGPNLSLLPLVPVTIMGQKYIKIGRNLTPVPGPIVAGGNWELWGREGTLAAPQASLFPLRGGQGWCQPVEKYLAVCLLCSPSMAAAVPSGKVGSTLLPFSCRFSRSDELSCHKRSHSRVKPYPCAACGKSFACSDHLAKHLKIHQ
ncbi:Krueppel-like factor 15, partial [Acanthisitta chloris]